MDVLVVDNAARGHALAWKIAQSPDCDRLWMAPGNAGTAEIADNTHLQPTDIAGITTFARQNRVDITVVSADKPLALGLVDALQAEGLQAFGPSKMADRIEASKVFAKLLMRKEGIPTAPFDIFADYAAAVEYANRQAVSQYLKEDELADGKGAHGSKDIAEFESTLHELQQKGVFAADKPIISEDELKGPEISLHAWCDGENYQMFPFAMQDHKTLYADNRGPMTGGMGSVGPVPGIIPKDIERLGETFVAPALRELARLGHPFKGLLYPGLKLTADGPKLLEWNARPGDPETQVWATLLEDDLIKVMMACVEGRLGEMRQVRWRNAAAACIVLAAKGYPDQPETDAPINGLNALSAMKNVEVFHYGTQKQHHRTVINSGRVLSVVGVGKDFEPLDQVLNRSYKAIRKIESDGLQEPRYDIGHQVFTKSFQRRVAETSHLF